MFRWPRIAGLCVTIDARRPASWLSAAAAAWLSIPVGAAMAPPWLAIAAGAMAAVAAVGDPPRLTRGDTAGWVVARAAWPAAAAVAAGVIGGLRGDAAQAGLVAAILVAVVTATAVFIGIAGSRGIVAADAASAALLVAAAAAATSAWVSTAPLTATVVTWLAAACLVASRFGHPGMAIASSGAPALVAVSTTAAGGLLPAAAMLTALVGMAVWLFLAPGLSWCYAFLASAWFIAAAVPQATLSWGERGEAARRRLLATAAAPAAAGRKTRGGRFWLERHAWNTVACYAAILGWPPLVAAALAGDMPLAMERLGIGIVVAVWGLGLAAVAAAGVALGCRRETIQAAALLLALGGLVVSAAARGRSPAPPAAKSPPGMVLSIPGVPARLPELRSLPRSSSSTRGAESCKES